MSPWQSLPDPDQEVFLYKKTKGWNSVTGTSPWQYLPDFVRVVIYIKTKGWNSIGEMSPWQPLPDPDREKLRKLKLKLRKDEG